MHPPAVDACTRATIDGYNSGIGAVIRGQIVYGHIGQGIHRNTSIHY